MIESELIVEMIDLHTHILPAVDDGAKTMADALLLARLAEEEGITTLVATPHHLNGTYENDRQTVIQATDKLNHTLKEQGVNVQVLPGQEIRISGDLLERYEKGELLTIGGTSSYIFVELPSSHVPHYTKQLLYDLQLEGLTPIIVHPERNAEFIVRPNLLYDLVKNGVLTQITASSLTGHFGKKIKRFTEQLIDANQTCVIASDAHNIDTRPFLLQAAYRELENKYGLEAVYQMKENAYHIIHDEHVYVDLPRRIEEKKRLFGLF